MTLSKTHYNESLNKEIIHGNFMHIRIFFIYLLTFGLSSCGGTNSSVIDSDIVECKTGYPEQTSFEYNLPYMPTLEFVVGQGNCTTGSNTIMTDQAYAYDFDMPIGTNVIAARAGTATIVVQKFQENNNTPGQENYLIIQHNDGTISGYYHLTQNGINVEVGDLISQGDIIAKSGNTGDSSEPHLHFEVALCENCETLPVNFKNTSEHTNGLIEGESYKAE